MKTAKAIKMPKRVETLPMLCTLNMLSRLAVRAFNQQQRLFKTQSNFAAEHAYWAEWSAYSQTAAWLAIDLGIAMSIHDRPAAMAQAA